MGTEHWREIAFYTIAWAVAGVCGVLSTFIGHRHSSIWDILAIGTLSGFIACSVIGFIVGSFGGFSGSEPYFLAIAISVGVMGKQSLRLSYFIVNSILKKIGVDAEDE